MQSRHHWGTVSRYASSPVTFQDVLSCIVIARGLDPCSAEEALDMVEAAFYRMQGKEDKSRLAYLGRRVTSCEEQETVLKEKWENEQREREERKYVDAGSDSF